tara:strand:- start:47 stop:1387 length:1341 start_codon:yes stop_codon:yes gene_type:complete
MGRSGTLVGSDYGGVAVLAAHEPLAVKNLGIVAKIDVAELRAPFVQAGAVSICGAIVITLLAGILFRRISDPIAARLGTTVARLTEAQRIAHVGDWERNYKTGILTSSDEAYRIFGLEPQETRPGFESFMEMVHPDDRQIIRDTLGSSRSSRTPYTMNYRVVRPDGTIRHVLSIGEWIFDETGNPTRIRGTLQDISDVAEAQETLRLAVEDAEQANQAKSEFLAAMSHELRTPLNAILGFADIIGREYLGPIGNRNYLEYAEDIQSSGEHLLSLVNDLLDISTIEAGELALNKEELSIREVVLETFHTVAVQAANNDIQLVTQANWDLPPLYADRRALRQILMNLASNAIKFTPKGGKITMSVRASKGETIFQVADTGVGISVDRLPSLTEPFSRIEHEPDKATEGWGLGLAITKSLVDLHKGTMEIESEIGKGTTVTVSLPNVRP